VPASKGGTPSINAVADNYFETVGTKLIEGRTFEPSDRSGSEPVAIVNAAMVKTLWEGKSPIGQCLYWSVNKDSLNTCSRIIGVVATAHTSSIREEPAMQYYIPLGHERGFGGSSLIVRPKPGHAADAAAALRKLINDVDPEVTYVQVQTLQQSIDPQVRPWRLGATLFTLMGVLALLVAAIGLYSVMSYLVAQRTQEIGVRIALGAQSWSIVGLILRSSASMAIAGVIIGVAIALGAGGRIKPLLFNTSPHDPLVLGGVAATLILVALVASIVPAMRAKRVHPMEALKSD
jgi:ABC-type antimicrobial peptide transport system permease subunit